MQTLKTVKAHADIENLESNTHANLENCESNAHETLVGSVPRPESLYQGYHTECFFVTSLRNKVLCVMSQKLYLRNRYCKMYQN